MSEYKAVSESRPLKSHSFGCETELDSQNPEIDMLIGWVWKKGGKLRAVDFVCGVCDVWSDLCERRWFSGKYLVANEMDAPGSISGRRILFCHHYS